MINLTDLSFSDYYDAAVPTIADVSLRRSNSSSILSRPNLLNFLKSKLGLNPVNGYRLNDSNVDTAIAPGRDLPLIIYYDEEVHNGAGKRLFHPNELRDTPNQAQALKQLIGSFVVDFIPTTSSPIASSISTTYFRIGDRSYWVEYRGVGWASNYATSFTTRLLDDREINKEWSAQVTALDRVKPTLAKMPISSIDFLRDLRTGEVYASDLNLAPQIGNTAIAQVLSGRDCWEEISRYTADNLEIIYDYLLVSNVLPEWMQKPDFRLTELVELRYLPPGSYWQCVEDGSYWKYLHGLRDTDRYFWRQKTSHAAAGMNQLQRGDILKGRSYRLVP